MASQFLIQVNFLIDGVRAIGAYKDQHFIGKVDFQGDQGQLKNLVPGSVAPFVPDIQVDDVLGMVNTDGDYLLRVALGNGFSLNELPFIRDQLPSQLKVAVEDLEISYASKDMKGYGTAPPLQQGLNFRSRVILGPLDQPLVISKGQQEQPTRKKSTKPEKSTPAKDQEVGQLPVSGGDDGVKWLQLKKTMGNVHLERIGLKFAEGQLHFLVTASVTMGPVRLGMDGLGIKSPIDRFKPSFTLNGLSLLYRKNQVSLVGMLYRGETTYEGKSIETYNGLVIIKASKLMIIGVGAYCNINNRPSLVVYGVMNAAIGGPPAFYVTALAAGFGVNRQLKVPPVEQVKQFPFVGAVTGGKELSKNPIGLIRQIDHHAPAAHNQYFLTFGVRFTSFNIINSFALLYFNFGKKTTLGILGVSKLTLPPQKPGESGFTLAQIELVFSAHYDFDKKELRVMAALTDQSYILARDCRLTGGFAFCSWFGGPHAGDMVVTAGGYHPDFVVPAHYPRVARLGLNWRLSKLLTVKGTMYFAMTSSVCMAGGHLAVVFRLGSVQAWFNMGLDLILSWKPFYYEASFYLEFGIRFRIKVWRFKKIIKLSVSAHLKIWGPAFSGIAKINLKLIKLKINFGGKKQLPSPLSWTEFKDSFLPISSSATDQVYDNEICKLNTTNGLLKVTEAKVQVVQAAELVVSLSTLIPISSCPYVEAPLPSFGVSSMGLAEVQSTLSITLEKDGKPVELEEYFSLITQKSRPPAALWGKARKAGAYQQPDLNAPPLDEMLMGFELVPQANNKAISPLQQLLSDFKYDTEERGKAYVWENPITWSKASPDQTPDYSVMAARQRKTLTELGDWVSKKWVDLSRLQHHEGWDAAFITTPELTYITD